jgi:hydroxypyruvate isomerase
MAELKFSAADWCFFHSSGLSPEDYYKRCADMGITGMEMVPEENMPVAKAAGLRLITECGDGMYDGLNEPKFHDAIIPTLREQIARCAKLGIEQLILFSGAKRELTDAEGIANCVTAIKQFLGDAEQAGVTLTFETLSRADHDDYHCNTGAFAFEVIRAVGSPNLKALYDIYHMAKDGEDVLDVLIPNLDLVSHLHVAGLQGRAFPVDGGPIDYKTIVQEVTQAGYDGCWGMEFMPSDNPVEQLQQSVDLFRSYVS